MDTDETLRLDLAARQNGQPTPPADLGRINFRPGEGGDMPKLWAEYVLHMWWSARDKRLTFADAIKQATVHFMVDERP